MEQLNHNQRSLIRTTAFAVIRNGTQYYEWLKSKRQSDPLYAFLLGGIGSKYYEWCLSNEQEARKEDIRDRAELDKESSADLSSGRTDGKAIETSREPRRSRSVSRSRSRSFRPRISRSPRRDRNRSPNRRWDDRRRSNRREDRAYRRERRRSRSPPDEKRVGGRHGKLYAWSSEEESGPKSSDVLKQKLESIKQKLREDSSVKLGA